VGVAIPDRAHHELLTEEVDLGDEVLGALLPYPPRVLVTRQLQRPRAAGEVADELVDLFWVFCGMPGVPPGVTGGIHAGSGCGAARGGG
jgi:hypothetical protein